MKKEKNKPTNFSKVLREIFLAGEEGICMIDICRKTGVCRSTTQTAIEYYTGFGLIRSKRQKDWSRGNRIGCPTIRKCFPANCSFKKANYIIKRNFGDNWKDE